MEKLEKENAILRFKLREVASVTNILSDAREEISRLEDRNCELAKSLCDLQTWAAAQDEILSKNRTSLTKKDLETSQLDPATMKNLSHELRRSLAEYFLPVDERCAQALQDEGKKLQERIATLENVSEVNRENKELYERINEMQQSNREKDEKIKKQFEEIRQFERILQSPEHAKDLELFRLRKKIEENKNDENGIHRALSSGTSRLKGRLESTLNMCQILSSSLDGNVTKRKSRQPRQDNRESSNLPEAEDLSSAPLPSLSESNELIRMRADLKDVLEKNVRWQIYNNQREEYVRNILQKYSEVSRKLQESQEMLAVLRTNPDKLSEEQRRYFDNLLVEARQQLTASREQTTKVRTELEVVQNRLQGENERLTRELEHWRGRYEEQSEASARLNAECESERRRSNCSTQENKEKKDQIILLRRQVEMYCEDFRAERREKEELRREIKHLRVELKDSKKRISCEPANHYQRGGTDSHLDISQEVRKYSEKTEENTFRNQPVSPPKQMRKNVPRIETERTPQSQTLSDRTNRDRSSIPGCSVTKRQAPTPQESASRDGVIGQTREKLLRAARRSRNYAGKNVARKLTHSTEPGGSGLKNPTSKSRIDGKSRRSDRRIEFHCNDELGFDVDSSLQCPGCGKLYGIDEHLLLLSHIDICG